jgi:hypothetical protein
LLLAAAVSFLVPNPVVMAEEEGRSAALQQPTTTPAKKERNFAHIVM